jgi:hypothetical protein
MVAKHAGGTAGWDFGSRYHGADPQDCLGSLAEARGDKGQARATNRDGDYVWYNPCSRDRLGKGWSMRGSRYALSPRVRTGPNCVPKLISGRSVNVGILQNARWVYPSLSAPVLIEHIHFRAIDQVQIVGAPRRSFRAARAGWQ